VLEDSAQGRRREVGFLDELGGGQPAQVELVEQLGRFDLEVGFLAAFGLLARHGSSP
jgi:hypothetical protein